MAGKHTHYPFLRECRGFHIVIYVSLAFLFLMMMPATAAFADEAPKTEDTVLQNKAEPVYIIPEQPDSVLKFGVSITPDKYTNSMAFSSSALPFNPFEDDFRNTRHADVSTVVRIALDEFKIFSGLNTWVHHMEKTVNGYSRKFMLTGELNLDKTKPTPVNYLQKVNIGGEIYKSETNRPYRPLTVQSLRSQFEFNKVTWDLGVHLDSTLLSFKLGIGDAIMLQSSAGNDLKVGALIRISL